MEKEPGCKLRTQKQVDEAMVSKPSQNCSEWLVHEDAYNRLSGYGKRSNDDLAKLQGGGFVVTMPLRNLIPKPLTTNNHRRKS